MRVGLFSVGRRWAEIWGWACGAAATLQFLSVWDGGGGVNGVCGQSGFARGSSFVRSGRIEPQVVGSFPVCFADFTAARTGSIVRISIGDPANG